ncbi:hypothetical protein ABT026_30875 [Streptomyces sp. NPDC002734]|uniref:hypothetical protein n=1 Tax=Streptomyces sp. NPDC002734 TaxID=3154426 RepID=UPI00331A1929
MRRNTTGAAASLVVLTLSLLTACSSAGSSAENDKAARFAAKVNEAGVGPEMTPRIAKSLYGNDGGAICAALKDNPAGLLLGWGRGTLTATPEEHADDLIAYDRYVVKVYCPEQLDTFEDLADRLNR